MLSFKYFISEEYYYHGTTSSNEDSILKNGADPSKSKYNSKLYLTKSHREAYKYGKIASGGNIPTVLKIHKNDIEDKHIDSNNSGVIEYKGKIDATKFSRV